MLKTKNTKKMLNTKRVLVSICLAVLMMSLTGCGLIGGEKEEPGKAAVCYVIANTANSQGLNMNSPLVQETAYETVRNYGYVSVVNVDGTPEVVLAQSFDIPDKYKAASKDKLEMDARSKATNLLAAMQHVIADDPEADYLAGLKMAIRSMSSLEDFDSKTIIVLGTGLGTSGVLDFRNNLLSAEPETVVSLLKEKEAIPDFTGITVVWQQMGDVAAPQQELTDAQRNKMQEIYGGIVESGNGTFLYNDFMANPVNTQASYPSVSLVELPKEDPIRFDMARTLDNLDEKPFTLSEEQVCFIPDSAQYLEPETALDAIRPVAEYLEENEAVVLLLAGCIAGDENTEYGYELSKQRADAVRETLVQLGIDGDRLVTRGLGCSDPWHIQDAGYDTAEAAANRKVVLLDASSELAQDILDHK